MTKPTTAARIGKAIRARRLRLGHSQESLAQKIEMHTAYFAKVERGEKNVTVPTLQRIAAGLGVRASVLLQEAGL